MQIPRDKRGENQYMLVGKTNIDRFYSFMCIEFYYRMKYLVTIILLHKRKKNGTHPKHKTRRQGIKGLIAKFVSTYVFDLT
jgi:hypothetical protein